MKLENDELEKILNDLDKSLQKDTSLLLKKVDKIVNDKCLELDNYIKNIKSILSDTSQIPTDEEIEDWIMYLPILLYEVGKHQELSGLIMDMAEAIRLEKYNLAYHGGLGTVENRKAIANYETRFEMINADLHERVYREIKRRCEVGFELLQSIKKVSSRRIVEMEITKLSNNNDNLKVFEGEYHVKKRIK